MQTFKEYSKQLFKAYGIKKGDVARLLHLKPSSFSYWLGEGLSASHLHRIAVVLKLKQNERKMLFETAGLEDLYFSYQPSQYGLPRMFFERFYG